MTPEEEDGSSRAEESPPETKGEFVENLEPRSQRIGRWQSYNAKKHLADTRRGMAFIIVGATIVLYAALTVVLICGVIDMSTFTDIFAVLSPLQALAAATVGFFFGSHREGD